MKSALEVTQGGEVSGFRKKLLLKGEIQRKSRLPKYNGALGMTMVKDRRPAGRHVHLNEASLPVLTREASTCSFG